VESLSPSKRRGQTPPAPPPRSFPVDDASTEEPAAKQQKLQDNTVPQKPPRAHTFETNNDTISVSETTDDNTVINTCQANTDKHNAGSVAGDDGDTCSNQVADSDVSDKSDKNQRESSQDEEGGDSEAQQQAAGVYSSHDHVGNSAESG